MTLSEQVLNDHITAHFPADKLPITSLHLWRIPALMEEYGKKLCERSFSIGEIVRVNGKEFKIYGDGSMGTVYGEFLPTPPKANIHYFHVCQID